MLDRKSFPYPVLGNGDDVSADFRPQLSYSITPDSVKVQCSFDLTDNYFQHLIAQEKAHYSIEFECGSTYFRHLITAKESSTTIDFPAESLRERVDVNFYICAVKTIEDYRPPTTHVDFGDDSFYIDAGDIIALGGSTSFIVAKEFDPLNAPISSIIKLEESNTATEMRVAYDSSKIIISLPKADYEHYKLAKNSSAEMLHSSLVLPVLVDAIYEIGDKGSRNYNDFQWADRLKQICIDRQINMEEPLNAAQKILSNPISRTLAWRSKEALRDEEGGSNE